MSVYKSSFILTNGSNGIRTWGKFISDGLGYIGWVKTADTGQIDFTTVTSPGSINTPLGYEIWRMADSLQGTTPVFMKIEYGCGATNTHPALWITLGSGSDGAGNLTGQLTARAQFNMGSYTTGSVGSFVSGSTSRLLVALGTGTDVAAAHTTRIVVAVERSHNANGADNSDGALLCAHYGSSTGSNYSAWQPATGTVPSGYAAVNCLAPPTGTGASGSRIDTFPVRGWAPGETSPLIGWVGYFSVDLTALNAVTVSTWDGSSHTYLPCAMGTTSYGGAVTTLLRFD